MRFDVFQDELLTAMRREMPLRVTHCGSSSGLGEKILQISSCVSLNTGGVIIFGLRPAAPPSPTHGGLVDFYKVEGFFFFFSF